MNTLITIHGPSAAGKTTLTQILNKELKTFDYINRPAIKKTLKPLGKKNSIKLSKEISYFLIDDLTKKGHNIISQEIHPQNIFRKLGKNYLTKNNYKLIPFYLTCGVETAIKRDYQRYGKLRKNKMKNMYQTYEQPQDYEIIIDTEKCSLLGSINIMLDYIKA